MSEYSKPLLAIGILDFNRESEARLLLDSLDRNLKVRADIIYCHDGPPPDYVLEFLRTGRIQTILTSSKNQGCGIQTRRLFQAAQNYSLFLYCQVDQFLIRPFTDEVLTQCWDTLHNQMCFYVDLAGNQGHGNPSERALIMSPRRYLDIPGMDDVIGGPGPYADHKWTERHLQDYMKERGETFATLRPLLFADNGRESVRVNPDGSRWKHYPDTKQLWLLSGPVKERFVYPKLSEKEWQDVINTQQWPDGKIPEQEREISFHVWN